MENMVARIAAEQDMTEEEVREVLEEAADYYESLGGFVDKLGKNCKHRMPRMATLVLCKRTKVVLVVW